MSATPPTVFGQSFFTDVLTMVCNCAYCLLIILRFIFTDVLALVCRCAYCLLINFRFIFSTFSAFFSSPEHKVLKVSYCDQPVSVVRRQSCVVNNSFKAHLLLNYWTNFKIISHKCSPEAPLPKLLKWFRSAEQNGRQS